MDSSYSYFLHNLYIDYMQKGELGLIEIEKKTLRRIFLGICGIIVFYWLLTESERVSGVFGAISSLFSPFVIGGVLAFILNVPMRGIENALLKKIAKPVLKRMLAIIFTLLSVLLVISLVFWLLIPQIIDTVNSLVPALYDFFMEAQGKLTDFLNENPKLLEWLKANTDFETMNWASVVKEAVSKFGNLAYTVVGGAIAAIGSVFTGVFNAVISFVFCIYCLAQKETLARQGRKLLYAFTKEKFADQVVRILRLTNSTFSNFLSGQCVEVCILGSLFAIFMAIFRMPYIPLISVVIAVTAFIPIVGAWIGCILGAFLIFVESPILAIWFVVMFIIIQQLENSLIYPRVVGTSVGLPGMWVLLAVAVGGDLMGVAGMFLMIPLVSVLYTLLRQHTNARLAKADIEPEKLEPQPPVLQSRLKAKIKKNKKDKIAKEQSENKKKE